MQEARLTDLSSVGGVRLKDWSAQDFANVYVRFRPHLMSHVRNMIRDEYQAEEIVQEAYLYLMTALPELDSELGVLRFLKWKTRMLSLDVMRSSVTGGDYSTVPLRDEMLEVIPVTDDLERADDAAIIQLALSKLTLRQREAIVATVYEQKSHQDAAQQLGMSENAYRQLLFRARASFKEALVGQSETRGLSISEVIHLAWKKHGSGSKRAVFSGLIVAGAASFSFALPWFPSDEPVAQVENNMGDRQQGIVNEDITVIEELLAQGQATDQSKNFDTGPLDEPTASPSRNLASSRLSQDFEVSTFDASEPVQPETKLSSDPSLDNEFGALLNLSVGQEVQATATDGVLEFLHGDYLTGYLAFDMATEAVVQHLSLVFATELGRITAVPTNTEAEVRRDPNGVLNIDYVATDFLIGDLDGAFSNVTVSDAKFGKSVILISLEFGPESQLQQIHVDFVPRS